MTVSSECSFNCSSSYSLGYSCGFCVGGVATGVALEPSDCDKKEENDLGEFFEPWIFLFVSVFKNDFCGSLGGGECNVWEICNINGD